MITKVFPDEFHLHTLDLLLSAIARLNPHVDLKRIVIGLMDRLSSYAARESEASVDPETRQQKEEEAVTALLQKLEISKQSKDAEKEDDAKTLVQENGTEAPAQPSEEPVSKSDEPPAANGQADAKKADSPLDVKLYDIFYEQVVSLIRSRGLPIQDTMALLVSLINLAL